MVPSGSGKGVGFERRPELAAGELGGQLGGALARFEVEAGDVDERLDVRGAGGSLAHHRAAIGVAGDDHGPREAVDDAAQVGGIVLQAPQRVRHRHDPAAALVEVGDDAVPAGRLGKGAVHEQDRRCFLRVVLVDVVHCDRLLFGW